jgi:hypothetical protein
MYHSILIYKLGVILLDPNASQNLDTTLYSSFAAVDTCTWLVRFRKDTYTFSCFETFIWWECDTFNVIIVIKILGTFQKYLDQV